MKRINFELNVTLACNLACPNCNRHCHLRPEWGENTDLQTDRVECFVAELHRGPVKAKRVKIAGGEPLLNQHLDAILAILAEGIDQGVIQYVKIDSNGSVPNWVEFKHPRIRWSGRRPARKRHLPTLWSPTDLGLPITYPCSMPRICGMSLDNLGYLPCSGAIAIVRTFGLLQMYRTHLATATWTTDEMMELCKHCVFAAPKAWKDKHCKPLAEITLPDMEPTTTWRKALYS